jgi:hypothetical protein
MKGRVSTLDGSYQGASAVGAIDLILDDDAWDMGILDLTFGYAMLDRVGNPTIAKSYIEGNLLQGMHLDLSTKMMDELARKMTTEGNSFNEDYGKIMERALGDRGDEKFDLRAGSNMLIFGFFANLLKKDHSLGSLENPAVFCIPEVRRDLLSLPYPASLIHIPWLAVRGSNRDILDITGKQFVDRFVMERMRASGQRQIIIP